LSKKELKFYHFKASNGEEIDILLQDRSGNVVGIEVKSNSKFTPEDFRGINYLKEKLRNKFLKGIVWHTGSQAIPFGENFFALPINSLWEEIGSF